MNLSVALKNSGENAGDLPDRMFNAAAIMSRLQITDSSAIDENYFWAHAMQRVTICRQSCRKDVPACNSSICSS